MGNQPNTKTSENIPESYDKNFSSIINLFKSVGISEKGIEKVYQFLLNHKDFVDPKSIEENLNFSLKRIYKIINELKNHDLVQIYGRPMEIKVNNPRKSWEKILNKKIDEINESAEQQINECKKALIDFFTQFKLDSSAGKLKPVEYISLITDNLTPGEIMEEIVGQNSLEYAKGLHFHYEDIESLAKNVKHLRELNFGKIIELTKEKVDFINTEFKIIISQNLLEEIFEEFKVVFSKISPDIIQFSEPINLNIKICENDFTNFAIRDKSELIQFSTTPLNSIIGLYKSREEEVISIFIDKFLDLYKQGKDIEGYFEKAIGRPISILDKIILAML